MNENYANEMSLKLKQINLSHDEHHFAQQYMQTLLPPPPNPATIETSPVVGSERFHAAMMTVGEIPRTLSMPPAYESQGSADGYGMQRHATGGTAVMSIGMMHSSAGASALLMAPSCPTME